MQFPKLSFFGFTVILLLLLQTVVSGQVIDDSAAVLPDGPNPSFFVKQKPKDSAKPVLKSTKPNLLQTKANTAIVKPETGKIDTVNTLTVNTVPAKPAVPPNFSIAEYGVVFPDSSIYKQEANKGLVAYFKKIRQQGDRQIIRVESPHKLENRTNDFFFLLAMCLLLGIVRFADRRYFGNLWKAFWSPRLSSRQLKEQLQASYLPNFAMNLFFTLTAGAYLYYVVRYYTPRHSDKIAPIMLVLILIGGMVMVYFVKYITIKFTGWVFNVEGVTEQYLFNVFLINKVLAVAILPIVVLMAFVNQAYIQPVIIVSFLIIGFLMANRYIRSWQAFSSFLRYSKFHFFTYLCASEILPLAVLVKLLVIELQSY